MTESEPPAAEPERNLLRALKPGTIEIHKALQRLLLQNGGKYLLAPHYHDWDFRPYVMSWPFRRELTTPAVLVFPWDAGTGQTLAEFCAYYKYEIPRRTPQTVVVTSTPITPTDLRAAEAVLESPIAALQLVDGDPGRLAWLGRTQMPASLASLADETARKALRDIDPGEIAEAFHGAQPKDPSHRIEADLVLPRTPSRLYTITLIMINLAVYVLALIKTMNLTGKFDSYATPVLNDLVLSAQAADGEWWRFITCGFMHIGVLHILFNMWLLYSYGPLAETVLGRKRFLTIYLLGLAGCSLFSFGWHFSLGVPASSAGASGALCGIFYGMTGYVLAVRRVLGRGRVREFMGQTMRFTIMIVLMGLLMNVDNAGHFGGGLAGFCVGFAFGVHEKLHPRWLVKLRWALVAAVFGLMLLFTGYAWPRAQRIAAFQSLTPAQIEDASLLDELAVTLTDAVSARQAGAVLYSQWNQLDRIWTSLRDDRDFNAWLELKPNADETKAQFDGKIAELRVMLCENALAQLQDRLARIRQACGTPLPEKLPASPPDPPTADLAADFVRRLTALNTWQGCRQERLENPDFNDRLTTAERLAQTLAAWAPPPPAVEPPAAEPSDTSTPAPAPQSPPTDETTTP